MCANLEMVLTSTITIMYAINYKGQNMEPAIQPQELNKFMAIKTHGKSYGLHNEWLMVMKQNSRYGGT